jgi:hypothetical protein
MCPIRLMQQLQQGFILQISDEAIKWRGSRNGGSLLA